MLDALTDAGLPASLCFGDRAWLTAHVYIGRGKAGRSSVPVQIELFLSVPALVTVPATQRRPARTKPGRRTLARMATAWWFLRRERS